MLHADIHAYKKWNLSILNKEKLHPIVFLHLPKVETIFPSQILDPLTSPPTSSSQQP